MTVVATYVRRWTASELWRVTNYRTYWLGQSVSFLGNHFTDVAIPLLIISIASSSQSVALAVALVTLPQLIMGLPAGVLADSIHPKTMLVGTNLFTGTILTALAIWAIIGTVPLSVVYAVIFLAGVSAILFLTTQATVIPKMVLKDQVTEANAKLEQMYSISMLIGPALAGLLVGIVGPGWALALDAATFFFAALCLSRLKIGVEKQIRVASWKDFASNMRAGATWLFEPRTENRTILIACLLGLGMNLTGAAPMALMIYHLKVNVAMDPAAIGQFLSIAAGLGLLLGSLGVTSMVKRLGLGRNMVLTGILTGVFVGMFTFLKSPYALALAYSLFNMSVLSFRVSSTSLRMTLVPKEVIGRVHATYATLARASTPIGALLYGWLGNKVGVELSFGIAAVFAIGASLLVAPRFLRKPLEQQEAV